MERHRLAILLAMALFALQMPSVGAVGQNAAVVMDDGDSNAWSNCQLIIIVNSVLVLGLEDNLGLATLRPPVGLDGLMDHLIETGGGTSTSCDIEVGSLTVTLPGPNVVNRVTGPASLSPFTSFFNGLEVQPSDTRGSYSSCQTVVFIGSFLAGGAMYGLSMDPASTSALRVDIAVGGELDASCDARVLDIAVWASDDSSSIQ